MRFYDMRTNFVIQINSTSWIKVLTIENIIKSALNYKSCFYKNDRWTKRKYKLFKD